MKPGDLVRHKAGGTTMVIESIANDVALCTWQTTHGEPKEATYALTSLSPATDDVVPELPDDEDFDNGGRSRTTGY